MGLRLEDFLAAYSFRVDASLDLYRLVNEILQPVLDLAIEEHERWRDQQDIDTANEQTIDAILRDLGNPFDVAFTQTLPRKKLLAKNLIKIYRTKGVEPGLVDVIRALTGIDGAVVVSPATIDGWTLGVDVIGNNELDPPAPPITDLAILGPSADYVLYSFQVEVPQALTDEQRDILREIVRLVKPAHTHFLGFLEPTPGEVIEHWELGLSALHEDGEPLLGDEIDLHE